MNSVDPNASDPVQVAVERIVDLPLASASPAELTEALRRADEVRRLSHTLLQDAVNLARANGVSWQTIGDTLGISRQAAFTKFDLVHQSPPGESMMINPAVNLVERTENVFRSLSTGDIETVRSMMTYSCARSLTKKKLTTLRDEMIATYGQLESISGTVLQSMDGRDILEKLSNQLFVSHVVGDTQLNHEAGEWKGRVSFNKAGKVTGILVASPGSGPTQF